MRRPIIVGEAPPRGGEGRPAFSGYAGRRLAALAGVAELSDAFDAVNILDEWPGPQGKGSAFPDALAARAAMRLRGLLEGRLVIVAGRRAARALGLRAGYLEPVDAGWCAAAVLPHPSGVNRWWNDPANRRRASAFLAAAARGRVWACARPHRW